MRTHQHDTGYKGHPRHASADAPPHETQSDKTDHLAIYNILTLHAIE